MGRLAEAKLFPLVVRRDAPGTLRNGDGRSIPRLGERHDLVDGGVAVVEERQLGFEHGGLDTECLGEGDALEHLAVSLLSQRAKPVHGHP